MPTMIKDSNDFLRTLPVHTSKSHFWFIKFYELVSQKMNMTEILGDYNRKHCLLNCFDKCSLVLIFYDNI